MRPTSFLPADGPSTRRRHSCRYVLAAACLLLLAALAAAPAALATNGGFSPVEPDSPNASGITQSWWLISIFTGAIFLLVEGSLVVFVIRFRRRRRDRDAEGPQIHGSTKLELLWTVAPVLILIAIGGFVFYKLPGIHDVPSASAAGGRLDVKVDGYRFYWQFTYPNGVVAVNELRAPVGQSVKLDVTAPDWDVIHSWWIPALGGKIDAIPGRTNVTWFRAERAGRYHGRCAELCGLQHAQMLADVVAVPQDEFEDWLDQRKSLQDTASATLGEETYKGVCATCHGLEAQGGIGPNISQSSTLTNRAQLETLLREGKNEMPSVGRDWSNEQIDALVAYFKTNPFPRGS